MRELAPGLRVLLASGYGLAMEVAQNFTDYRNFSLFDALFNTLGAVAAAVYIKYKAAVSSRENEVTR